MKKLRRGSGVFDAMLTRAATLPPREPFWISPEISPKNQADLDAQRARDEANKQKE